jgi:hypothetical protein
MKRRTRPASVVDLVEVARLLGPLLPGVVFTGGVVVPLLITDPAAPPTRETYDVDLFLEAATSKRYHDIEARLRANRFTQDLSSPLICRWSRGRLDVDLMPDDERILGFSNRWYRLAAARAQVHRIDDLDIRVIDAPCFIATKFEAFASPSRENAGDLQASHDLEDIVTVIDGRASFVDETAEASDDLRTYLGSRFAELLANPAWPVALAGHLGGDDRRAEIVSARLQRLARRS